MKECFDILKRYKHKLSRQQILTFKGQILAKDYRGFKKGISKIMKEGKYDK